MCMGYNILNSKHMLDEVNDMFISVETHLKILKFS